MAIIDMENWVWCRLTVVTLAGRILGVNPAPNIHFPGFMNA